MSDKFSSKQVMDMHTAGESETEIAKKLRIPVILVRGIIRSRLVADSRVIVQTPSAPPVMTVSPMLTPDQQSMLDKGKGK